MSARKVITRQQHEGIDFLTERSVAMLADVPGLGKTAQLVIACDAVAAETITIIVPNRTLALNVQREFKLWSLWGHDVHILNSAVDDVPAKGVVITTYALASRPEVTRKLRRRRPDVLACDEAHALKEISSARSKAILQKTKGLLGTAKRVWLFTGTPAPNHAGERYVFAKITGAWKGSYNQFAERFCVLNESAHGITVVGSKNHAELKALVAPYYLRRDRVEGRPPLTIDWREVEGSTGADPYDTLDPELRARVEEAIESGNWRFEDLQAVATVRRLVGLAKADGVIDMAATDLDGGYAKCLIFCQHSSVIDRIISELGKRFEVAQFDGRVSESRRAHIIDAFQKPGGLRVIVGQTQAMGEGHTLTAANRVLIAEPAWTPKDNDQCIARAWRRGQLEHVLATFISLRGSLDKRISAVLQRKSEDVALLV